MLFYGGRMRCFSARLPRSQCRQVLQALDQVPGHVARSHQAGDGSRCEGCFVLQHPPVVLALQPNRLAAESGVHGRGEDGEPLSAQEGVKCVPSAELPEVPLAQPLQPMHLRKAVAVEARQRTQKRFREVWALY